MNMRPGRGGPFDSGRYIINEAWQVVPCEDLMEWAEWLERERRHWQLTHWIAGVRVSTVFLGLDHAFGFGPPVLWETMVFDHNQMREYETFGRLESFPLDTEQHRHLSREDAYLFHQQKVEEIIARLSP